jgi:hypothetical protein
MSLAISGAIVCGECGEFILPGEAVLKDGCAFCPHCGERVCRLCGCTQHNACGVGCAWDPDDPEVCDAH